MRAGIYMLFPLAGWKKSFFLEKRLEKGSFLSKRGWNFIVVTAGHRCTLSINLFTGILREIRERQETLRG